MKVIIVGGVAGGAACAARLRRLDENAQIIVFERGEYVSFANCGLPYYAGDVIKERERLLIQTPASFYNRFNVEVRVKSNVIAIDRKSKSITVEDLVSGKKYNEAYDKLVLSPGANPFVPPIDGADLDCVHTVRTVPDIDKIRQPIDSGAVKKATVIGAGFIGIEMAENFKTRGVETHLIEKLDQVMPPFDKDMAVILQRQLRQEGIKLHLNEEVIRIVKADTGCIVETRSGKKIPSDMVILSVGVKPETDLARGAGLRVGKFGIVVDESMMTDDPDIYAIGDAVQIINPITGQEGNIPLAWPAARQGVIAANNMTGLKDTYKGSLGTSIVKVFALTAAMTGASEKVLRAAGKKYEKIYTHPANHAGYYPGASQMHIKLMYDPDTNKILGAQIVGHEGVDKRVDVLSLAIRAGVTLSDLAEQEFCYAPPYGSAKDAINLTAMAALNHIRGISRLTHWEEIKGNEIVLDVRTEAEFRKGSFKGAVNIPVDSLRSRITEIPKGSKVAVFCQVGIRAHVATRILRQKGYDASNISGGYLTFRNYTESLGADENKSSGDDVKESFCTAPTGRPAEGDTGKVVSELDLRGLQCPGPIVTLDKAIGGIKTGEMVRVMSNDDGFIMDLPAWCLTRGNTMVNVSKDKGDTIAVIMKGSDAQPGEKKSGGGNATTIVVFSGDLDKVMAALIIARSAAASGRDVSLFFTFWGLNALKKKNKPPVKKDLISKMFGLMMPRSIAGLALSKMDMMGMGTSMMKAVMKAKNVESVEEMLQAAIRADIELVACSMSMDVMGIKKEELVDGVKVAGAAYYVGRASAAGHNLFI